MSALHPIFQRILATTPHSPPVICRRCDDVINPESHTMADCESTQQEQALAADIAANFEKAHKANEQAFIKAMFAQIRDVTA